MDLLLSRIIRLVGDEAIIILATALSQQPCLGFEETGGRHGYRPHDLSDLLRFLGIGGVQQISPVMAQQFWIHFDCDSAAAEAEVKLSALRVGARVAIRTRRDGSALFASCPIQDAVPEGAELNIEGTARSLPFFQAFYAMGGAKSGMHHPDGILWIRHPQRAHEIREEKVSLLSVAPTILEMMGIPKPEYMKGEQLFSGTGQACAA